MQQKILRAEVKKETGRWKGRWTVRDLLADGRCAQAVLDFLSSTDVGWLVLLLEEGVAGSAVPECELWERRDRKTSGRRRRRVAEWGAGEELPLFLPTPAFMGSADEN